MNKIPPRFYTYIFFEVPDDFREGNRIPPHASSFFESWKTGYQLKEDEHASDFDLGDPELTMIRMAENQGLEVCIFRFHDIDLLEIEWNQPGPDASPPDFWKRCTEEFEKQLPNLPACLGMTHVCFAHKDDFSPEYVGSGRPRAKIPSVGTLYHIGKQGYLLISDGKDPADFLGRDFPLMISFILKLRYEYEELGKIRAQTRNLESLIQKRIFPDPQHRERRSLFGRKLGKRSELVLVEDCQSHIQRNLSLLWKLRQTLNINIRNLRNYHSKYSPKNDTIFGPVFKEAEKVRRQLDFDLNYIRAGSEGMESYLRTQWIRGQRRLELLIIILMLVQILVGALGSGWHTLLLSLPLCFWLFFRFFPWILPDEKRKE